MGKIILTGFEPFGKYCVNPVQESTEYFHGKSIGKHEVVGLVLQCTYRGAFAVLKRAIGSIAPVAVVSTGFASRVKGVRFETKGKNAMYSPYPDADGVQFAAGERVNHIIEGGLDYEPVHSNTKDLRERVTALQIPTEISEDSEGFICNALLYLTSRELRLGNTPIANAFLHVPCTEECADKLAIEPEKTRIPKEALHAAIHAVIANID